jgi:predicted lactoylglutathione lyase
MKLRGIWANLGVSDLERTTKFYTAVGFKTNGRSDDLTSFTVGEEDFVMHFFIKEKFEIAVKGEVADLQKGNEIVFSLGAKSKDEVDNWARKVNAAGGKIISKPEEFGEGYYGFDFADPDGHRFNVFYM